MRLFAVVVFSIQFALAGAQAQLISDITALERDCGALVANAYIPAKAGLIVSLRGLPPSIASLKPRRVLVDEEGVHIELQQSRSSLPEIFYLRDHSAVDASWVLRHGFTRISDRIYTIDRRS